MIISTVARYLVLLHLATGVSSASFRGSSSSLLEEPTNNQRSLQTDCSSARKKNQCNQPCLWQGGQCVPGPTPAPTLPPTPKPSGAPTFKPTMAPTVGGMGYCSDNPSRQCMDVSFCDCGGGAASAPAPDEQESSTTAIFDRRRLNVCAVTKRKDCPSGECAWIDGTCVSTATNPPTPTPPPTRVPTKVPTSAPVVCDCLGLPPTTASPTGVPTEAPTPKPSTAPTFKPTSSPTELPTPKPTTAPTFKPTGAPTTASPTNPPTEMPTPKPTTFKPTSSPTELPTPKPTTAPTFKPTNAPTNKPTDAPTELPTSEPTSPPTTNAPTSKPTAQPTDSPTSSVEALVCPPVSANPVIVTHGIKSLTAAASNTFCGIFLRKQSSGDIIPLARSYHGQDWESAPGPLACPTEDVTATSVVLPELDDPNDEYIILTKDGTMDTQRQIAKFLEMTSFGPKMSEITDLESTGVWDDTARANYIREQMDLPANSHREYWRKRTNSKWDATAQPARSSHPCSPNSKWRRYSYTRQDRYHTITSQYIYHEFETVPEEANLTYTIYDADPSAAHVKSHQSGTFITDGNSGHSGTGYYDFGGLDSFMEFEVDIAEAGTYPISFRFALGSSSYNGNRPCQLLVNDVLIKPVYDFIFTDSWSYWKYSDLVDVSLTQGLNTIKLLVTDQNGGPNLDHLRVGKPPAMVMKTNGWPRVIAKSGINCLDAWPCDFTNQTLRFDYYPDPPQGDLYRYYYGRLRVRMPDGLNRFLDIGNPPVDFDGYQQYLPPNVFNFSVSDVFVDSSSDLYPYPIQQGQEMLLENGYEGPECDSVPPFAEEYDAPIVGILPSGEYIQWSPTILLEDNGPSINTVPQDMAANVLSDGGGEAFVQTNEKLKCSNVPRSFVNEDTCFLSTESTACSASNPVGEVLIPMNTSNVIEFYNLADKYVYAIRGLVMEDIDEHACRKSVSRWTFEPNTSCSAPTQLESTTTTALTSAISTSSDGNEFIKDVTRTLACDSVDEITDKIDIQIQVGSDCYTHVHPNHLNVYDFSGWVTNHPGGEYNIQKWAEGWEGTEGWYLDFPFEGNTTRKIPKHQMSRWYNNNGPPDIEYVARLGDSIAYRDLPNDLKTDAIASYFGAVPTSVIEGGVIVCGSIGEVSNDPALEETFDVRSNEHTTSSSDLHNNQKSVVWTEIALYGQDQLRQRMAWALAQIVTTVPGNIDAYDRTEVYTAYYDIFVKHAFGNYRDILAKTSYSPLMAEHLSYLRSKSHSYVYSTESKRISRADENFAREVMQLFSIGLIVLNDDGTPKLNPATGEPLQTYTNEDIESFARAWTGFDRTGARGNYEESRTGSSDNRLDPMRIRPEWRDPFPKSHLNGGFIGDGYVRCEDLPAQAFLKKGAGYRLLGGKSSPELMKDHSNFENDANGILRLELDSSSPLFQRLFNGGNYELFVELENDLVCTTVECNVDTLRVVKVGSIYYEYVERPCVQMAFYDNGKQIMGRYNTRSSTTMCANPNLPHAREACCREDRYSEVRTAHTVQGQTYRYEGERMTWPTAQDRCTAYGRDLCVYENIQMTLDDDWWRKGSHWTNRDCGVNVKVNSEGYIAIVHDAMSTYNENSIPYLIEEENTLNWFRVFWNGGSYPGDSEANTCAANDCKAMSDGSCLCKTTITESVVFTDTNVSKEEIMSQLFMGALGPPEGSNSTILGNGVTVHVTGAVDGSTVFEVEDKGRTLYFKNLLSTVGLEGWTMPPVILEAEDASTINNANVRNNTSSATGRLYVEARLGNATTYVEWDVSVPSAGSYLISLRYALDSEPRPLDVFVNSQEVKRQLTNANSPLPLNNINSNPGSEFLPLERCAGDCDNDSQCADGLFCMKHNGMEVVPGCSGTRNSGWDYCLDVEDFDYGFTLLPTGGWDDDWHYSKPLEVNLIAGSNSIRVQLPAAYTAGLPNIDHLKVEGISTSTSPSSFRNPPHFMGLIPEVDSSSEQNLRDAEYETKAVLDHYFFQDNTAPFLCVRVMQRFSFSNPSPRFVSSCVNAFRTGLYTSGTITFGSGEYGSLEAMAASIFLDREATEGAISSDPSYGAVREPILKVIHLMRSMDYQTSLPTTLDGPPMQTSYNVKLWEIDEKIGQGPYEFPTVFSFFLPEYVPDSGPSLSAQLSSPEAMLITMPNVVALLNGMFSLIKYGLSDCNNGFSTYPGFSGCSDNGQYTRSYGHLFYEPTGQSDLDWARNLSLLLTAGRLGQDSLDTIVEACLTEPDKPSKTRCMQQLIVSTGEYHSTSTVTQSGEDRVTDTSTGTSTEPYKAIVYFYLGGGMDSYNMLAPHTCGNDDGGEDDVYAKYRTIRGKSEIAEGVGLPKSRLLDIQANNDAQPCSLFGIHENLPKLKELYDQGKLKFIANAGLLAKPVTVADYRQENPVQLFAHNDMTLETKKDDIFQTFAGTGVGGRIADVLTQSGIPTNVFSIDGQQILLTGEAGQGPSQFIISGSGLSAFNNNPSIANMDDVIKALNNDTTYDSGFCGETWSQKLSESLAKQELLKSEVDATVVTTAFPSGSTADEFEMITRIMQTREARGVARDIFYLSDGGYDTHSNVDVNLINNFDRINAAMSAFIDELQVLGLWENTVVIQFSEFARTLDPNTGEGTDHAWGGNHFIFGGSLNGGQVLGQYPSDFEQGDAAGLALSRGRMIPTSPWDTMWKPVAEWFGVPAAGPDMDKVLPMHKNFPPELLYNETDFFQPAAPASSSEPAPLFD